MRKFNTKRHKKYWAERKIDWDQAYTSTWDHPHRKYIVEALKSFRWFSLWEVGCASGPNLIKIAKELPNRQLGGSDVSADAIETARKTFVGGRFKVESVEDMLLSDDSVDVVLSDATLIYIDPSKIDKAMHEITRVARERILLCEFHSKSWWKRWKWRLKSGYNAYDYEKLLEKHGCYDIKMWKIPESVWGGEGWGKFGYIIMARITK